VDVEPLSIGVDGVISDCVRARETGVTAYKKLKHVAAEFKWLSDAPVSIDSRQVGGRRNKTPNRRVVLLSKINQEIQ
jgi:hypothetical protein